MIAFLVFPLLWLYAESEDAIASYVLEVILAVVTFGYFVVFEITLGWTPAKKVLGLSVRGPGGMPNPVLRQSAFRNSFELLDILPIHLVLPLAAADAVSYSLFGVVYITIAATIHYSPTKEGLHDNLAGGTQVLKGGPSVRTSPPGSH